MLPEFYAPLAPIAIYGLSCCKLLDVTEARLRQLDQNLVYFKRLFLSDKTCLHHHTCSSDGPKNSPKRSDMIYDQEFDGNELFDINQTHQKISELEKGRKQLKEILDIATPKNKRANRQRVKAD